jgi:hypothetical protein
VSISPVSSPVVVDGIVSDEKLSELLALQAEYPELDFKGTTDLTTTEATVELAKDIGAMQVRGGYIVIGVDGHGAPTGELDDADRRRFDEASLTQKMLRWLPPPLELRVRTADRHGHCVVLLYVGRHTSGCAFFIADGTYRKRGKEVVLFRAGEVFWRDGTRSTRMSQQGLEEVIARRITDAKTSWLTEQREIRLQERADLDAAYEGRKLTEGPLGTVSPDMDSRELNAAALEFIRRGDPIGLQYLLNETTARARAFIDADEIETELGALLDKLVCLAATFLEYEQWEWFDRVVDVLVQIYAMPLAGIDPHRFAYASWIPATEAGPRVWLQVVERVFALGALAVRRRGWAVIQRLTLQLPDSVDYQTTWLRHALTMASRAHHLREQQNGQTVELSLLSLARGDVARLGCLRPDGLALDSDEVITSLAQFDVLSNITAVVAADDASGRVFYPSFARVRQHRVQPVVERLLTDDAMRTALGVANDASLASALTGIAEIALSEGQRYDGFSGWAQTPVGDFIIQHLQAPGG